MYRYPEGGDQTVRRLRGRTCIETRDNHTSHAQSTRSPSPPRAQGAPAVFVMKKRVGTKEVERMAVIEKLVGPGDTTHTCAHTHTHTPIEHYAGVMWRLHLGS